MSETRGEPLTLEEATEVIYKLHECAVSRNDEIDRLQAIVDRLPKTADGVPIVPHDQPTVWVFTKRTGLYRPGEPAQWWDMIVHSYEDGKLVGFVGGSHMAKIDPSECYSTKEAAEAAGGGE